MISGVVFLGTPHIKSDRRQAARTLGHILALQSKSLIRYPFSSSDVFVFLEVCRQFEVLNLQVPVISVYESKETSQYIHILAKFIRRRGSVVSWQFLSALRSCSQLFTKANKIVPEALSRLGASQETVVDSGSNHIDVYKLPTRGEAYGVIVQLAKSVMQDAPDIITKRFADCKWPRRKSCRERTTSDANADAVPPGLANMTLESATTTQYGGSANTSPEYNQLIQHPYHQVLNPVAELM